jgi:O-antigen ligase
VAILFAILLVVIVATSSAFEVVSNRVGDVGSDLRWQFTQWSLPLARQYWVFGSGMETFKTLFETQERLDWLRPTYVNAVHNDYLQLLIEGGLPGLAVLSLLVASLIGPIRTFRRMSRREPRRLEIAFGLSVLVLFALHSAVDYPLRRPAAWVLFALGLAAVQRRQGLDHRDVSTP